jgi:hypothetical protein
MSWWRSVAISPPERQWRVCMTRLVDGEIRRGGVEEALEMSTVAGADAGCPATTRCMASRADMNVPPTG